MCAKSRNPCKVYQISHIYKVSSKRHGHSTSSRVHGKPRRHYIRRELSRWLINGCRYECKGIYEGSLYTLIIDAMNGERREKWEYPEMLYYESIGC